MILSKFSFYTLNYLIFTIFFREISGIVLWYSFWLVNIWYGIFTPKLFLFNYLKLYFLTFYTLHHRLFSRKLLDHPNVFLGFRPFLSNVCTPDHLVFPSLCYVSLLLLPQHLEQPHLVYMNFSVSFYQFLIIWHKYNYLVLLIIFMFFNHFYHFKCCYCLCCTWFIAYLLVCWCDLRFLPFFIFNLHFNRVFHTIEASVYAKITSLFLSHSFTSFNSSYISFSYSCWFSHATLIFDFSYFHIILQFCIWHLHIQSFHVLTYYS